ncbi:MAG: quercetin dioxygenase-like cupin family protein [Salinirussus sp.]|jgi:quercetin dioxygenase-like cupin family protein
MTETEQQPLVRHSEDIEAEPVDAADGLTKAVLVGEEHGAPNVAVREFRLAPGGTVPRHTNEVEHEQYVLQGEYVVGVSDAPEARRSDGKTPSDEEYTVGPGDAVHIPAGAVHWYRNEGTEPGVFICAVPTGDDAIQVVDDGPGH